ncbi:MAG: hypothetical protein IJS41_04585, partial [Clostridia bacterium]|nr:hypothetical protein [Clostridia bacterium]
MREQNQVKAHLEKYIVTYLFIALSVLFIVTSGMDINYVASQLLLRLNRNAFIVLALIIPIIAGMGINFAITIGAMAAQIGLLLTINWGVTGVAGILLAAAITLPLGAFFGFLIGKLLNKMKGQETIGSLILGYFANGAYQLLFLFIFGTIIPLNSNVTIVGASGVPGILLAAAITLPLGAFFGFLIGKLLNKMKGQETIGSLILGYFANGAYQLLFLFIFGT